MKPFIRSPLKIRIFGRNQDATEYQPEGTHKYVEALRRGRNAGFGRKDFLERTSKKQHQWLWFIGLWCGGLAVVFLLASVIRWMMRIS
jgi:hypothetical protein